MDLEGIMLSEISQTEKDNPIPLSINIQRKKEGKRKGILKYLRIFFSFLKICALRLTGKNLIQDIYRRIILLT